MGEQFPSGLPACSLPCRYDFAFIYFSVERGQLQKIAHIFQFQYGFGDTVAYISIRFIVGVSRAGIGYGVYGVFGNLIATIVPIIGGSLLDQNNGNDIVLWYFSGLMGLGALCWIMVFFLEGARSLLELPAEKVIETSDNDIRLAALTYLFDQPLPYEPKSERSIHITDAESVFVGTF